MFYENDMQNVQYFLQPHLHNPLYRPEEGIPWQPVLSQTLPPASGNCFYAIYRMLFSWVREGTCPPHGERIAVDSDGENRKDALGNAIGGVRTPFQKKESPGSLFFRRLFHPLPVICYRCVQLFEFRKDALGNAIGGVRTPFLDVPVAAYYPYSAIKRENGVIDKHGLFGHTEPFSKHKFEKNR